MRRDPQPPQVLKQELRALEDHTAPDGRPSLCPRFLAHMKACPADLRPRCFLSSKPRPRPPQQGQTEVRQSLSAPKMHAYTVSRSRPQYPNTTRRRCSAVVVPCVPTPVSPCPSRASPELRVTESRPPSINPHPDSAPPQVHHPEGGTDTKDEAQERGEVLLATSVAFCPPGPDLDLSCGPEDTGPLASPVPSFSEGSLSDFTRPPSSQFSRSTDLSSGRSSVLSEDLSGLNSPLSRLCSPSMSLSALASCTPQDSPTPQPLNPTLHPPLHRPVSDQLQRRSSDWTTPEPQSGYVLSRYPEPSLDPNRDCAAPSFPSETWRSSPSPQCGITLRPGSGLVSGSASPSTTTERKEWTSSRWSVLPPISPARDGSDTVASQSRCSQVSSSQSRVFDELEAVAPRTSFCPSLDHPLSSADCSPPGTDMSPGLAALTVGCDMGELGSLSRVQLLLLDRPEPMNPRFLSGQHQHSLGKDVTRGHTAKLSASRPGPCATGVLQPVTAASCGNGSASERCAATGEVRGERELTMPGDPEDGPRSPWSWTGDSGPSDIISRSPCSPCQYSCDGEESDSQTSQASTTLNDRNSGPGPDQEASEREEPGCTLRGERVGTSAGGRRRPGRTERRMRQKERIREERKTKVLNIYSKLQDRGALQPSHNRGRSKFEDFNFLAKYCIFSQEKLTEYKRAFEAVDSDRDGYISCLQVLLGLKKIIPSELLSDEEEIYVYRILEMVDFRVTDGLTDLRLFAVIASLAQKIATMDVFMRSLISKMDFRSLELKLYKAKQLFLFLLEGQSGGSVAQQGCISAEQLLVELKAGGVRPEQEEAIKQELQHVGSLDLLDFLAYLPLFLLIHNSVITNPLDDSSNL